MTVGNPYERNPHPGLGTAIVGLCFSMISWVYNPLVATSIVGVLFSVWGWVRTRPATGGSRVTARVITAIGLILGLASLILQLILRPGAH